METNQVSIPEKQIDKLGAIMYGSQLFKCKNIKQGMAFAMLMIVEKIGIAELAKRYHLVGGRLMLAAGAAISDFRKLGGEYEILERTADVARVRIKYGNNECEYELTWQEIEEAKEDFAFAKGKVQTNWATPKRRKEMLWYRLMSDSIVAICPEVYYSNETRFGNAEVSIDMVAVESELQATELSLGADETESDDEPDNADDEPEPDEPDTDQPEEEQAGDDSQSQEDAGLSNVSSYQQPTDSDTSTIALDDLASVEYVTEHIVSHLQWLEEAEDPDNAKAKVVREFKEALEKKGKRLTELTYAQIDSLSNWLKEQRANTEIPF